MKFLRVLKRLFGKADDDTVRQLILILLLDTPMKLDAQTMEVAARKAWVEAFGANDDGSPFVFSGTADSGFVLSPHGNAVLVFPTLRGVRNLDAPRNASSACAAAWAKYSADVSVGLAHAFETRTAALQKYIALLTAELIDTSCLALLHLASGRMYAADKELRQQLRDD